MMRSTIVTPSGVVCSKKPRRTMSLEWPSAALRSLAFSRSAGRPRSARIWLCRQRIAARMSRHVVRGGVEIGVRALLRGVRLGGRALLALGDAGGRHEEGG